MKITVSYAIFFKVFVKRSCNSNGKFVSLKIPINATASYFGACLNGIQTSMSNHTLSIKSSAYNLKTMVNHLNVSYDDLGEGIIPIIFLHGFPFDKTMWQEQIDFLKASNRVIAYDIRGFGKSTDEVSILSIDLFVDDLIGFMDSLAIEKAIVCGFSMGGYIALKAVKKYPDRFSAMILSDTQCIADTPEAKAKRYQTIDEIALNGSTQFIEKFIKNVFHKDSLINKKELVANLQSVAHSNSQQVITAGLVALAERTETCSFLSEVTIPCLIICGREDVVTPLAQSESMNTKIKGSILCVIEKAGHVSNLEQARVFNKHLADFLNSIFGKAVAN
ncbi:MAG: alpha/beta hydrolase [Saprospiraceae bacterium]